MNSAIQLIDHKFLKIEINAQPWEGGEMELHLGHSFSVKQDEDDHTRWMARLDIKILNDPEKQTSPYRSELSIVGHFELNESFPKDSAENMVKLNAGAILYGALREVVHSLTARSVHGELMLPTIDARTFIEQIEKEN